MMIDTRLISRPTILTVLLVIVLLLSNKSWAQHGFPPNGAWAYGTRSFFAGSGPSHHHNVVARPIHYHHHWHGHHAYWITGSVWHYPRFCISAYPVGWASYYHRVYYAPVYPVVVPHVILSNNSSITGSPIATAVRTTTTAGNLASGAVPSGASDLASPAPSGGPDLNAVLAAHRNVQELAGAAGHQPGRPVAKIQRVSDNLHSVLKPDLADLSQNDSLLLQPSAPVVRQPSPTEASSGEPESVRPSENVPAALLEAADRIFAAGGYTEAAKAYAELTVRYGNNPSLMLRRFAAQVASRDFISAEALAELAAALGVSLNDEARDDTDFASLVRAIPNQTEITEDFARRALNRSDDPLTLRALATWLSLCGDHRRSELFRNRAAQLKQ